MEDYRKADPKYFGFVPTTAAEAIDLFFRLKRNGMHAEHHPEAFVWAAPSSRSGSSPPRASAPPRRSTRKRKRLEKEADARDLADRMNNSPFRRIPSPQCLESKHTTRKRTWRWCPPRSGERSHCLL